MWEARIYDLADNNSFVDFYCSSNYVALGPFDQGRSFNTKVDIQLILDRVRKEMQGMETVRTEKRR